MEADPLYLRAIEIGEKTLGPDHPDLAIRLNNRAVLLESQGKYDEIGPLYERFLAIREKALGPDHPAVATALNNWAGLLSAQVRAVRICKNVLVVPDGCYRARESSMRLNLSVFALHIEIGETSLGPYHPDGAVWLNNRAGL
eukprot:g20106.t1